MTTTELEQAFSLLKASEKIALAKKLGEVATRVTEEYLREKLTDILARYNLATIGWTQWTPYFNDGDHCTLSYYDIYVNRVNLSEGEVDEDKWETIAGLGEETAEEMWERVFPHCVNIEHEMFTLLGFVGEDALGYTFEEGEIIFDGKDFIVENVSHD